jgi:4-amino-4-deoxy-L-arabinose transferase-like glycosyltransferase
LLVWQRGERWWDDVARLSLIVGAAIRMLVVLDLYPPTDHVYSDSLGYVDRAMRVAAGAPLDRYDAFYPPGTHLLLSIPFWLIGNDRTGLIAGAVLWTALSALTPLFMWRYARLLLSPAAAALTALFCALWPIHIAYGGHFMSEVPALAFMVGSLWFAEHAYRSRSGRMAELAGIAGGLAIANRPALVLNVALAAWPFVRRAREYLRSLGLLVIGVMLAVLPVVAYATAASGHFTLSENSGLVFYMGHCNVKAVEAGPPGAHYFFESPVTTQLERGTNVNFPDHDIWDQGFFYSQGFACIAQDGIGHVRMLLRNVFDMGLSTVPWPPSNDPWVRDIVKVANIAYVVALPFILFGAIRLIRRRWPSGGGRGELTMLLQLGTVLVTAIVYFGDPRYRTPYDVFGLALLGSLIADRYLDRSWVGRPFHPRVRAEDAVEEHDEGALGRAEAAREVDPYDARPAEADGELAVRADDGTPEEARWGETRRTRTDEELGLIDSAVHEVPTVGPDAVDPEGADDLEAALGAQVLPVGTDAPDGWVRDEEPDGVAGRGDEPREEVDSTPVKER